MLNDIEELTKKPGNKSLRVALDRREINKLGKAFVGDGYTLARGRSGEFWFISEDGKRMYRGPTPKSSDYATTGKQANFHQRTNLNLNWSDDGNVDVHVNSH